MSDHEKQLVNILRERGLAWAIDMFSPSSNAAACYLESLQRLEEYVKTHQRGTFSFTPESLSNLNLASPYKADAFLQALVSIHTTPILCAAWRILQGMEIDSIDMRYARLQKFTIHIVLRSPYGETEEYDSEDINDVVFVRHLGKSTVDAKPFFNGFYGLRQT